MDNSKRLIEFMDQLEEHKPSKQLQYNLTEVLEM